MSDLAYTDTIGSKLLYSLFLFSSFASAGTSFARVLKWGERPVIRTFVSFRFLKIILLIVTRFLIQSVVISVAVKSLMFQYVIGNVFTISKDTALLDFFNVAYRGICPHNGIGR